MRPLPAHLLKRLIPPSLVVALIAAGHATAADRAFNINIQATDLNRALIALSDQAHISIGGVDPATCRAKPRHVRGHLSPQQALNRLLAGSACVAEAASPGVWRLKLRPPPAALDKSRLAPPPAQSITVVATRNAQRIGTAPASISAISSYQLADTDSSLDSVAPRVAGLLLTDRGPGRDKMFLRGLTDSILTGRTQSTVGLYLDDAPIIHNAPNPDLLLIDLAGVEVLKGPQGALYGEGSVSGLLRISTNKPNLTRIKAEVGIGYGESDNGEPSRRQHVIVNLPLVDERLGLRLVAYHDLSGGYLRTNTADPKAANASSRDGGRLGVNLKANDDWQVNYSLVSQTIDSRDSQYVAGEASSEDGRYTRSVLMREPNTSHFLNHALSIERTLNGGKLKINMNRLRHNMRSRLDAHELSSYFGPTANGFLVYDEAAHFQLSTQEINFVSDASKCLRYMGVLQASRSRENFTPSLTDLVWNTRFFDEDRTDDIRSLSAYGEVSYDIDPSWTVSGGLRTAHTDHRTSSRIYMSGITATAMPVQKALRLKSDNVAHQVSINFHPDSKRMFYLLSADGYRTGGFNTSMLKPNPPIPERYDGDYLHSYEAGVKLLTDDERISVRIAAFHLRSRNTQSDQLQETGLPVTINLGTGTNTGLEIEGDWRVSDALRLHGAAQFNDSRLDQPNTAYIKAHDANMPLVAASSFALSADWLKLSENTPYTASATLAYRGPSRLNLGGRDVPVMGGYTTLDLNMSVRLPYGRLSASLNNATNTRGNTFAYGNPFSLSIAPQSTPLRPRTLWLLIRTGY